ncbi:SAM-dependent DNA methyltransferase [Flavobacteriaceae bacterium]|nr:SAM-dependent DNA methyltransferase [Flavobacteriaceae bacterium]
MINNQIKSKERVSDHGEVFTSEREVNNMLDLVKQETERLDSRFLEPACGDGNFLIKVLERKINVLLSRYKKKQYEFEKNSVVVISSIYGIDILEDNVEETQNRLFNYFKSVYSKTFKGDENQELLCIIKYILSKNIIHGDALSLRKVDSDEPVTFCEWSLVNNSIKRRDFTFEHLLQNSPLDGLNLFSDLGEDVFIPTPTKEYPLTHYLKLLELC